MASEDIIVIGAIIFAFAIGFFVVNFAMTNVVDKLGTIEQVNESEKALQAFQDTSKVYDRFDYVIFGLFIGLVLALIVTGWFVGGNAIFMMMYFLIIVLGVIMSIVMSKVWESTTGMVLFGTTINAFPLTNNLMVNLPIYTTVIGFIGLIVMFGKPLVRNL